MRLLLPFLFILLLTPTCNGQSFQNNFFNEQTVYFGENGDSISVEEFKRRANDQSLNLSRWDYRENDSIRIACLTSPKLEKLNLSYTGLLREITTATSRTYPGTPTIIIHYNYLDDLCSPNNKLNYWDDLRVRRDKRQSDNLQRLVEKQHNNVITLHFFEPGITIEPSQILKQFFYIDHNSQIKNALFKNRSYCGSTAVINPGGRTLIYNGKASISAIVEALNNWDSLPE